MAKQEVLIDVSRLIGRLSQLRLPTGVDRVCQAYVAHWAERAQAVVQHGRFRRIVPVRASRQLFDLMLSAPDSRFRREATRVLARACIPPWPSQDGRNRVYFNLGHTGLEKPGFAAWIRRARVRPVFVVHDLIPITHPEFCRPGEGQRHEQRMRSVLQHASGVVANSQHTLEALRRFAAERTWRMPTAQAAHLAGSADISSGLADAGPPVSAPYFVVLGTIEPRKNHILLLQVWRRLIETHGESAPRLVIIGQRGWECENVVDLLERSELLKSHVIELAHCDDAALSRYLQHARALLFPSFAEGYGMPLVEALTVGVPVIASDLAVFREVAGAVPDYLSAIDGLGWAKAIEDYARPFSARRETQKQRMAHFAAPTWHGHFEHVHALLERLP